MVLTINGGLVSIVERLLCRNNTKMAVEFNGFVSIICLFWFYKQRKFGNDILSALISSFFLFSYFTFQIGDNFKSDDYYFLSMMLSGLLTGFILLLIGIIKKIK
jgi:hypothetical protein